MKLFVFSVLIIAIVLLLLSVRVIIIRNGKFPNLHIDGSNAMKDRNIHCAIKEDKLLRMRHNQVRE